jgi:hypothetical protein
MPFRKTIGERGRVMDTRQDLELTIRTATLIKSLSQLIGARDARLSKMMFAEAVEQFGELGSFIDKCNGVGKNAVTSEKNK